MLLAMPEEEVLPFLVGDVKLPALGDQALPLEPTGFDLEGLPGLDVDDPIPKEDADGGHTGRIPPNRTDSKGMLPVDAWQRGLSEGQGGSRSEGPLTAVRLSHYNCAGEAYSCKRP